jgi:hypothetical protein
MRLALVLSNAGPAAHHDEIVADARELILANRRLSRTHPDPSTDVDAIVRRITLITSRYGIRTETLFGHAGVLSMRLPNGSRYRVPL